MHASEKFEPIKKYFAIGSEDGYPNFYVIDLTSNEDDVLHFEHESGKANFESSTIATFLEELLDDAAEQLEKIAAKKITPEEPVRRKRRSHYGDDPEYEYDDF